MKPRTITKKEFPEFLAGLAKQAEVWAPVKLKHTEGSRFGPVENAKDVYLGYLNTKLPVKELFFPQREVLFHFKPGDPSSVERKAYGLERIVLGVRPCDAAALLLFDRVFLDPEFLDPYYQERREKTTLVGLACNEPGSACFCTALSGNPYGTAALDLLLVDLGEKYLALPVTERAEKLVSDLTEAKKTDLDKAEELKKSAAKAMKFALDLAGLKARLDTGFDSGVWDELALPCVNCGVCTYVCPTCHCFDVTDEEHKGEGARLRTWDSCQFSLFTRHASGHNPRPTGRDRMRQRTLHKFRYFPETHKQMLCVGCGRCIVECPAGIDLRETLATLNARLEPAVK